MSLTFDILLLIAFAAVAFVLAAVGVYGVVSVSLQHHPHELGVRVALGAPHRDIFALILGHGMRPAFFGAAVGLADALTPARFLRYLLFEVEPANRPCGGAAAAVGCCREPTSSECEAARGVDCAQADLAYQHPLAHRAASTTSSRRCARKAYLATTEQTPAPASVTNSRGFSKDD